MLVQCILHFMPEYSNVICRTGTNNPEIQANDKKICILQYLKPVVCVVILDSKDVVIYGKEIAMSRHQGPQMQCLC